MLSWRNFCSSVQAAGKFAEDLGNSYKRQEAAIQLCIKGQGKSPWALKRNDEFVAIEEMKAAGPGSNIWMYRHKGWGRGCLQNVVFEPVSFNKLAFCLFEKLPRSILGSTKAWFRN